MEEKKEKEKKKYKRCCDAREGARLIRILRTYGVRSNSL